MKKIIIFVFAFFFCLFSFSSVSAQTESFGEKVNEKLNQAKADMDAAQEALNQANTKAQSSQPGIDVDINTASSKIASAKTAMESIVEGSGDGSSIATKIAIGSADANKAVSAFKAASDSYAKATDLLNNKNYKEAITEFSTALSKLREAYSMVSYGLGLSGSGSGGNGAVDVNSLYAKYSPPPGYIENGGILPECAFRGNCDNIKYFLELGINIAKWLFGIIGSLALLMFIYGGFMMVISMGSDRYKKGKDAMVAAVVGIVICFSAYLLVSFILESLGVKQEFNGLQQTQTTGSSGSTQKTP